MTNILKDNKGNALRVKTCKYCLDPRGKPKLILPEDLPRAIRMPDGSYKCESCQIEEIENKIVKVTPNSDSAKRILADRAAKQKKDAELKRQWEGIKNMKYGDLWKNVNVNIFRKIFYNEEDAIAATLRLFGEEEYE
jgi:hypothetical protein